MSPDDPVRLQAVPRVEEIALSHYGQEDPLAENEDAVVPGLVHRYPDRCLMVLTNICPMLCRHCTRKTDVKEGCGKGDCGACTVLLKGKAVNACLTLTLQAAGQEITTLKGIGTPQNPHPLQESVVKHGAIQCGFCTAGMILAAKALLDKTPRPTREEIREGISGNLCRCTGYQKIIKAIEEVGNQRSAGGKNKSS